MLSTNYSTNKPLTKTEIEDRVLQVAQCNENVDAEKVQSFLM